MFGTGQGNKWNSLRLVALGNATNEDPLAAMVTSEHTDLDALEKWNVSSVTNMESMFEYCESLENIDALGSWDVSLVLSLGNMFQYCGSLENIDALGSWNVSSVTEMSWMFGSCKSLQKLDALEKWDVSSVTLMRGMFCECVALADISGVQGWFEKLGHVMGGEGLITSVADMFNGAGSAETRGSLASWVFPADPDDYCTEVSCAWERGKFSIRGFALGCPILCNNNGRLPYSSEESAEIWEKWKNSEVSDSCPS